MESLPLVPLELICNQLDLVDQIKCRILSKKFRFIIDNLKANDLIIDLKFYNFRRLSSCWYGTQEQFETGNTINLNFSLKHRYELLKNQFTDTKRFSDLKRLKLIFLSRYQNDRSNSNYLFGFIINNLFGLFANLEHLELEVNFDTLSSNEGVEHSNLKVLYINYVSKEIKFRINCPKLIKLYFGGVFRKLSIDHPSSIQFLEANFSVYDDIYETDLSCFNNLKHFHYFGLPNNLNKDMLTTNNLEKLETFNYKGAGEGGCKNFKPLNLFISKMSYIIKKRLTLKKTNLNIFIDGHKIENRNEIETLCNANHFWIDSEDNDSDNDRNS